MKWGETKLIYNNIDFEWITRISIQIQCNQLIGDEGRDITILGFNDDFQRFQIVWWYSTESLNDE